MIEHLCFECRKPFASMADIRIHVEDEGTEDIFWGPVHRNCQMARESAINSLAADISMVRSGTDRGNDDNEPPSPC